jgi:hypothetical protein
MGNFSPKPNPLPRVEDLIMMGFFSIRYRIKMRETGLPKMRAPNRLEQAPSDSRVPPQ